jgi:1,4-dihydroxy-2-naphthoate octaprenyltransferase
MGMIGGWFYSMPPLQLERTMWGEVDNALLGGYLMPLIAYIPQVGVADWDLFLILTPIFLAVLVNLLGVHWLDREADAQVGKNTLVVRLRDRVPFFHLVLTVLLYTCTLALLPLVPWQVVVAVFLTTPLAIWANLHFKRSPEYSSILMIMVMIFTGLGWILAEDKQCRLNAKYSGSLRIHTKSNLLETENIFFQGRVMILVLIWLLLFFMYPSHLWA